ncbi:hypothetical protein CO046_03935 [Candidatus Peregrinibacteria bacterium CG_4_9_14_0_2_um_filter_53_11]|nr:MAG: hypothetical protein CO046_03935 [Candidatus Peregrinibacteria bacterium CG_4_9_14_0_2_um_filter_53_11]
MPEQPPENPEYTALTKALLELWEAGHLVDPTTHPEATALIQALTERLRGMAPQGTVAAAPDELLQAATAQLSGALAAPAGGAELRASTLEIPHEVAPLVAMIHGMWDTYTDGLKARELKDMPRSFRDLSQDISQRKLPPRLDVKIDMTTHELRGILTPYIEATDDFTPLAAAAGEQRRPGRFCAYAEGKEGEWRLMYSDAERVFEETSLLYVCHCLDGTLSLRSVLGYAPLREIIDPPKGQPYFVGPIDHHFEHRISFASEPCDLDRSKRMIRSSDKPPLKFTDLHAWSSFLAGIVASTVPLNKNWAGEGKTQGGYPLIDLTELGYVEAIDALPQGYVTEPGRNEVPAEKSMAMLSIILCKDGQFCLEPYSLPNGQHLISLTRRP